MFTGLIEATGRILAADTARVVIGTPLGAELQIGDSVAVNGVCLTAVDLAPDRFAADVSPQTRRVTTAGTWRVGDRVNLERPVRADTRLGGHFVLGHVDAVASVLDVRAEAGSYWLECALPPDLAPLVISRGSIAVDGISLTVAALKPDAFGVQIVPHTWAATTLSDRRVGDVVNLEADVLGKHVARLVECGRVS